MLSVYRTLSVRYLSRRWFRALLIVASIALGVATLVATQSLNATMSRATLARINPMPSVADFVVSYSQAGVPADLARTLEGVPGVEHAWPRIFDDRSIRIPLPENRSVSVMVIGIDRREFEKSESLDNITFTADKDLVDVVNHAQGLLEKHFKNKELLDSARKLFKASNLLLDEATSRLVIDYLDEFETGRSTQETVFELVQKVVPPVMVGQELVAALEQAPRKDRGLDSLYDELGIQKDWQPFLKRSVENALPSEVIEDAEKVLAKRFKVQRSNQPASFSLLRVGSVTGKGDFAMLGGNVLIMEIEDARKILGTLLPAGKVNRIDVTVKRGANKDAVLLALREACAGKAEVSTPEEHVEAMGSALNGMRTGFSLCGLAALVVGLFLVYNALSVSVTERRHEIGVLLSLGATQRQVRMIFGGEAAFLGVLGSLLGIPLGIAMAYIGLQPAKEILGDIFMKIEADRIDVSWRLLVLAMLCGVLTALFAGLVPAAAAAKENPASAVRQVSKAPSWSSLGWHISAALGLMATGLLIILVRDQLRTLQEKWSTAAGQTTRAGTYAGMILFLLGALVGAPLLAAIIARVIQPLGRRFFPITWRLASDNLVLAPGRTGLVIAALAAGVALVTQTYGILISNQKALKDWVQESFAADLIVTSGSPVAAGGNQSDPMTMALGDRLSKVKDVEAVLPMSSTKIQYRGSEVLAFAFDAGASYRIEKNRQAELNNLDLYDTLSKKTDAVIISDNFRALYGVSKGDTITLNTERGEERFFVIGSIADYSFNRGTIFFDMPRYKQLWKNDQVDMFDVFVQRTPGMSAEQFDERVKAVKTALRMNSGESSLVVQTRQEFQERILDMIHSLYVIALVQFSVVTLVAFLGVVMALLIAVLQRRREMGMLRAIGASQSQVVRSVLAEAFLMGVIGTIIGVLVGVPLQWYVLNVVILEESGFLFPMHIPWLEGVLTGLGAMAAATLAGLGPAIYSVRMRIPEAIAYE